MCSDKIVVGILLIYFKCCKAQYDSSTDKSHVPKKTFWQRTEYKNSDPTLVFDDRLSRNSVYKKH